jgi:flagellar motility protein MotE (MotC chaperone)
MNVPRLLPLIGVAVVGVIGVNALSGARDLPQMLSAARAYAEGVATPAKGRGEAAKAAKDHASDEAVKAPAVLPPGQSVPQAAPAGVCALSAADLAKAADLTQTEWTMLNNLKARRGEIDQQSKDVDTQTALLAAAEVKLDSKLKAMVDLKTQIEALLGQADQKTQAEVDRLTVVYSKMNPKQAAPIMAQLDDKVRVPIAAAMKPQKLSDILKEMQPAEAKKLTELLAHRYANVQALADAAKQPPASTAPTPPAKDAKADAKAKPNAQAAAKAPAVKPDPNDANVDDSADKPAKPKAKQLAKRAPAKKKPIYHAPKKAPVEQAKASTGPKSYSEVKDQTAKPAEKPAAAAATAPTAAAKT